MWLIPIRGLLLAGGRQMPTAGISIAPAVDWF
jgi:hypothetical protein